MASLRDHLQDIVKDKLKGSRIRVATVVSVEDDGTCTCMMIDSETVIAGIRLQADEAYGIYVSPAVDSTVILAQISDFDFCVIMFSKIDYMQLLDGSYGGLVKVQELTEKLNNLESQVNDLLTSLQGITIPLAPSGTYPFAPVFASFTPLTPTQPAEIQNPNIEHGQPADI